MTTPTSFRKQGLLSTGDIAKRLGVHRTTVWHWIKQGMLKSVQVTPRFRGVTEAEFKIFRASFIPSPSDAARVSPTKRKASKAKGARPKKKAAQGAAKKRKRKSAKKKAA